MGRTGLWCQKVVGTQEWKWKGMQERVGTSEWKRKGMQERVGTSERKRKGMQERVRTSERKREVEWKMEWKGERKGFPLQSPPLQTSIDPMQRQVKLDGKELSQRPGHKYDVGLPSCWHGILLPSLGHG